MSATAFDRWLPKALGGTDPGFVEEIARAAGSGARWDGGWRLVAAAPDGAWLAKGDTLRPVRTGEFAPDPVTGWREFVWLLVEREIAHSGPGFHFILGRVPGDVADEASPARFYLHTTASSAPRTSGVVARMLDDYRIPFRYKTLNSPGMYDRADASVLYVAARHTAIVENMLQDAFSDGPGRLLEPSVPLFSRQVGPGIGFAVDPANGESFGTDRCRLVAEGVIDAWRAGDMTEAGRWAAIDARFSAVGLSLDRPWLRAGQVEWT